MMTPKGAPTDGEEGRGKREEDNVTRREAVQIAAAALVTSQVLATPASAQSSPAPLPAAAQSAPRFFTAEEFKLVDELCEMIIPTDAQSSGARAAGVAGYIDSRLAETTEPGWQDTWRNGLKLVDGMANEMHGKTFLAATPEQRVATLTRMAVNETAPKTPSDQFFRELKFRVVRGYYSSKIGIHVDQTYKGNVIQPGEYAGIDAK
jgi:hypothetical protein